MVINPPYFNHLCLRNKSLRLTFWSIAWNYNNSYKWSHIHTLIQSSNFHLKTSMKVCINSTNNMAFSNICFGRVVSVYGTITSRVMVWFLHGANFSNFIIKLKRRRFGHQPTLLGHLEAESSVLNVWLTKC